MRNLIKESLNEKFRSQIDLKDHMKYYVDMKKVISDDKEYRISFKEAIHEFGVNTNNVGVYVTFNTEVNWEDLKTELDKKQMQYYEFELYDGESVILIDTNDLQSIDNDNAFKRSWGSDSIL